MPGDEHGKAPELEAVRTSARHVIGDHASNRRGIERGDRGKGGWGEKLFDERARRSTEPGVHWNAEALLAGSGDIDTVRAPREVPQYAFGLPHPASVSNDVRQPKGELREIRIEKRRPHFETVRHAHAIGLGQDVVGQVLRDVGPLQLAKGRMVGRKAIAGRKTSGRAARRRLRSGIPDQGGGLVRQPGAVPRKVCERRREGGEPAGTFSACSWSTPYARSSAGSRSRSRAGDAAALGRATSIAS